MACPALSPNGKLQELAIGLAPVSCALCSGTGQCFGVRGRLRPCACVARAVCRICLLRYDECRAMQGGNGGVSYEQTERGRSLVRFYGMRREEYIADVELTARRVLLPEEWSLFELHMLRKLTWRACCPTLRLDRGNFFHAVYRIETKLGLAFGALEPYSLLPGEYFGGRAPPPAQVKRREWYAMETEGCASIDQEGADAQPEAAMGACG